MSFWRHADHSDIAAEQQRLHEADATAWAGAGGGRTSATGSGAPCARTTAPTATPGATSATTRRAPAPTAGARTASPGISDDEQRLCLALALWNGRDPILKERFFGLTNAEGNHGEDVKEYYFYLDGTPTHSYMRMLYKYPQREYPYDDLVATNRSRGRGEFEYELLDTGVFADEPLLRRRRRVRQGRARGRADADHRAQPGPGRGRPCTCCRPCGSATPGRGAGRRQAGAARGAGRAGPVRRGGDARDARPPLAALPGRAPAAVHRERDQRRAPVRQPEPVAVRQGRHRPLRRARRDARR